MGEWKSKGFVAAVVGVLALSGVAEAQGSASGSVSGGAHAGLYLEFQGRLDAFNVAGVEALGVDSGDGGGNLTAPVIPYVTAGVRLLEGDLFIGLGLGVAGISDKSEAPGGEQKRKRSAFMLSPVVTYDFVGDGPAAFYGVGMLSIGSIGGGEDDPGGDAEPGFWWGLNLGLGLRGDITEYVSLFSELGWGFASGTWESGEVDESRFIHGIFGTIGFAVRLGL